MNSGIKPDRLELARLEKLEKIQSLGHDPWGQRFDPAAPPTQKAKAALSRLNK
jgi:hypothetical protein